MTDDADVKKPDPIAVLLSAVELAQSRGAYKIAEIGVVLEAYNNVSASMKESCKKEEKEVKSK